MHYLFLKKADMRAKLTALQEWEALLQDADLLDLPNRAIDDAVVELQTKKVPKYEESDDE